MLPPSVYGNGDIPAEEEARLDSMTDEEIAAGVARGSVSYRFEQKMREQNALILSAINAENERKEKMREEARQQIKEGERRARERELINLNISGDQPVEEEKPRDWCGTSRLERKLMKLVESDPESRASWGQMGKPS